MFNINFIKENNVVEIAPLNKGWSGDKKYILTDNLNNKFLLRISSASKYEKRKMQYEYLTQVATLDINCSKALEFGLLDNGDNYMVLTFLEGKEAEEEIFNYDTNKQYQMGFEAGRMLRKIHSLSIPPQTLSWWERYQEKMQRKIDALVNCPYKLLQQEEIINYYKENAYLMKDRPLVYSHGDYHLGNMVINDGVIGVVDFDKVNPADPYDEFKPFCWNVMRSEYFETGLINGYFDNKVPEDFFKILKFYTAESLISHLPWAVGFGEEEIKIAFEIDSNQMKWYDNFKLEIPTWYKGLL